MPAVSVLMPCYNAAQTIQESLESLKRQSLADLEVIAVDDGSSDGTLQILQASAEQDPRIRVLSQPHGGIIPALNAGLAVCRATYVARMDADDIAYPERLALQVDFLDQHPQVCVVGSLVEGFPPQNVRAGFRIYIDWLNSLTSDEAIRREIFIESPLAHPSVTFRRETIEQSGGYQERGWPEDYDLWLRLYLAGRQFAKVPEVLLAWRESPQRLTRSDSRYSLENFLRLKAYYLARGPLAGRDAVILWGAGMMGRRLSKQLQRQDIPLAAFIDIDPRKIGRTRRGLPILSPEELPGRWQRYENPAMVAAVGARGARPLIRTRLAELGLQEGRDWWCAA